MYIWVRNDLTEIDHNVTLFLFGDELNVESNSWSQIFWMAHVTLFKYLIISNHYFTKKGFTDKDRVLVIICGNNLIHMWICLTLSNQPFSFPPQNVIFEVEIMIFLMPGQNFCIFASPRKGMDTFYLKWAFTFKNFSNVYWHGKTHSAMWYPLHILLLLGHQMQLFPMVANHWSNDAMFAM